MESKKERRKRKHDEMKGSATPNEAKKLEEDVTVKGSTPKDGGVADDNVRILRGLNMLEYVQERAAEMTHMSELLLKGENERARRMFQIFPRHMRRRAASHDIRRIPRKFHEKAKAEESYRLVSAGLKKKNKKFVRKHRRKSNQHEEYQKRQRNNVWLETHIWHAKRFKMVEKWGYKLAHSSCQRGIKAGYRMSSKGCTLQDISFLKCLQLYGSEEDILKGLKNITHPDTGLSFASKLYLDGSREGSCFLYHKDSYPYHAIGPVKFLWKSKACSNNCADTCHSISNDDSRTSMENASLRLQRQLWLWSHPAYFKELQDELISVFSQEQFARDKGGKESSDTVINDSVQASPEILTEKTSDHLSQQLLQSKVTITDCSSELNRIRLTGPFSHSVLGKVLKFSNLENTKCSYEKQDKEFIPQETPLNNNLWRVLMPLTSQSQLASHVVLGLTVVDPRLNVPVKKQSCFEASPIIQQVKDEPKLCDILMEWPTYAPWSVLWDVKIRSIVKETKVRDSDLNARRAQELPYDSSIQSELVVNRVPILLIQRPGPKVGGDITGKCHQGTSVQSDYGSGWDIILPSGWTMPFWIACIYQGARAVGLQDTESIHTESLQADLLLSNPDTAVGISECKQIANDLENKMNRRPPNKRTNFQRLGIHFPYYTPWSSIVSEWSGLYWSLTNHSPEVKSEESTGIISNASFFLLRNQRFLREIDHIICSSAQTRRDAINNLLEKQGTYGTALVPVAISYDGRGCPDYNSVIALPRKEDFEARSSIEKELLYGPVEPLHKGLKKNFRTIADVDEIDRLTVPTIGYNSRWTLGHVTKGKYCFSRGKGGGVGLVSFVGLLKLIEDQIDNPTIKVLLRNVSTLQYRLTSIRISMPSDAIV